MFSLAPDENLSWSTTNRSRPPNNADVLSWLGKARLLWKSFKRQGSICKHGDLRPSVAGRRLQASYHIQRSKWYARYGKLKDYLPLLPLQNTIILIIIIMIIMIMTAVTVQIVYMGGGTFGLHNGLGGQSIVHTQCVPPPPPQLHCHSERSAAHDCRWVIFLYKQMCVFPVLF